MHLIDKIYIDGEFVTPKGTETADLHNPSTEEKIGTAPCCFQLPDHGERPGGL